MVIWYYFTDTIKSVPYTGESKILLFDPDNLTSRMRRYRMNKSEAAIPEITEPEELEEKDEDEDDDEFESDSDDDEEDDDEDSDESDE